MAICTAAESTSTTSRIDTWERVHYSFPEEECAAREFTERHYPSIQRTLQMEGGARCFDNHVGVLLDGTRSLSSAQASVLFDPSANAFRNGLEQGLAIELWITPQAESSEVELDVQYLLTLNAAGLPAASCQNSPGESSLALMINAQGCLQLVLKAPPGALSGCLLLPAFDSYCQSPDIPAKLDLNSSRPQHVVVSMARKINSHVLGQPPRFAIYVDGVLAFGTDGAVSTSAAEVQSYLLSGLGIEAYIPSEVWPADRLLHVFANCELYMLAIHDHNFNASEATTNFAAGLLNSKPTAGDAVLHVAEDVCTPMPLLLDSANDWDNSHPFLRSQLLSVTLDASSLSHGSLHTDAACATPGVTGLIKPSEHLPLFFLPVPDEHSNGDLYATVQWSVSDDASPPGTAFAAVLIYVNPVNDAPSAFDVNLWAYEGLPTLVSANGSDVDHSDQALVVADTQIILVRQPRFGEVRDAIQCPESCVLGEVLGLGERSSAAFVYYQTTYRFGSTSGKKTLAEDSFTYQLAEQGQTTASNFATVNITVRNGLGAESQYLSSVVEEKAVVITLRGVNQGRNAAEEVTFQVVSLPPNGRLWQYDATSTDSKGAVIQSPNTNLSTSSRLCEDDPLYYCPMLVYEGNTDFFSFPRSTNDLTPLNTSDDTFSFVAVTASQQSERATVTLRVSNLNDPPTLRLPDNATYYPRIPNRVASGARIDDPDLGVGVYLLSVDVVGPGTVSEFDHKQNAAFPPSWKNWQWALSTVQELLGYCPQMCIEGTACTESCTSGNGRVDHLLRVFCTPATCNDILANVVYETTNFATFDFEKHSIEISVEDFDSGIGLGESEIFISSGTIIITRAEGSCTSVTAGACGFSASGDTAGAAAWIVSILTISALSLGCVTGCKRQQMRTKKYGNNRRKRPRWVREQTNRVYLPVIAGTGFCAVLLFTALRSTFSPYALYRMDFSGDGFCGANATEVSENNGCSAGVPSGFLASHCLGDVIVCGMVFPLLLLELSGRPWGKVAGAVSSCIWLIALSIRAVVFSMWEEQVAELPWRQNGAQSIRRNDETRPYQNSWSLLLFLSVLMPPISALVAIGVYYVRTRARASDEEGNSSDDESFRQHRSTARMQSKFDIELDARKSAKSRKSAYSVASASGFDDHIERSSCGNLTKSKRVSRYPPPSPGSPPPPPPPPPAPPQPPSATSAPTPYGALSAMSHSIGEQSEIPPDLDSCSALPTYHMEGRPSVAPWPQALSKQATGRNTAYVPNYSISTNSLITSASIATTSDNGAASTSVAQQAASDAWLYMDAAAVQRGPVRREELRALHQNGAITGDTLVWNDEVQTTWAQLEEQRLIRM